ncbi:hypothetical protein L1D41_03030 [Vibrio harveyi]|uniref:hypothetical protein n=1 Tax=Vibrio harveyi TaxID=669 RepID=UPI001EFE8565|nr:hypothetical protein [Vibrio harveyi]MCG9608653.1 hypothetical protein [Vibrio harveyi]MCG9666658.1 hypothetical protein [Vibrio harveyi]
MKTAQEFRNFTVGIKLAMDAFSIVGVEVDVALLRSELGYERASDVIRLVSTNLRSSKHGATYARMEIKNNLQSRKLRNALSRQRLRNSRSRYAVDSFRRDYAN